MQRILCVVLALCFALPAIAVEEPPAFIERPAADVEPLIPQAIEMQTIAAPPKLDADAVALLPQDEQPDCEQALIWQSAAELDVALTPEQQQRVATCQEKVSARLQFLDKALLKLKEKSNAPANEFWSTAEMRRQIPIGTGAMVFDVPQCMNITATTGSAAEKCAAMLQKVATQAEDAVQGLHKEGVEITGAKSPVSFAQSWESIVINSLADQMVVQLQGVASQKLLGVFGDTLCKPNVKTYFPETCNLLAPINGNTNVRLRISQLPAEFQRTLRNDLVTLLPAAMQMARINDTATLYFVPLLLQARGATDGDKWIDVVATYKCPQPKRDPSEKRICATLSLVAAGAQAYRDFPNDQAQFLAKLQETEAVDDWAEAYGFEADAVTARLGGLQAKFTDAKTKAKSGDALMKARLAIALWRDTITTLSPNPLDSPDRTMNARLDQLAALDKFDRELTRWGSLGRAVYRVADGFRKGYDPLVLSIDAAKDVECIDANDLGCTVKFASIAVSAFREVADAHKDEILTTTDQTSLLVTITREMQTKIETGAAVTEGTNAIWTTRVKKHFEQFTGEAGPPLLDLYRDIQEAREIGANKDLPASERDIELTKLYAQMVDTTFEVWRLTASVSVPEASRARVERLVSNTRTTWRAARERNYLTLAGSLYSLSIDLGIGKPLPESAERYRLLLTNLASADSQDQFKTAVDTYLSQSAASISKFDHSGSITLSGLPGVSLGRPDDAKTSPTVFAPVGVDGFIRFPQWRFSKVASGIGVFASVLDLGNLVAAKYKQDDGSANDVENSTSFRDVFAPGLFLRMPLGQSGFSLGFGRSRIPLDTDSSDREYRWKKSLFLSYDMSWFTFWRRD